MEASCHRSCRSALLLLDLIVKLWLDEAAELLVNKVSVFQHLFPGPDALTLVRNPLSPDFHRCLELLEPLVALKIFRFTNHASASLTALHYLLEHYETLKLRSIHVVWQLGFPFLVGQLYHFLKDLVKLLVFMLLNNEKRVVKLVLD